MDGQINSGSGKTTTAHFQLKHLTQQEKRQLAFKALGLFWLLALITFPLPPIHWLTVPGFFLFGIYQFFKKLKEPTHLEAFTATCPECGKEIPMKAQVAKNPMDFVCPSCRYTLFLQWDESAAT